jgi:hypothetical protein
MDDYTKSLIKIGFLITLFTVVVILGIFYIYRAFGNVKWPPESQKCPDHWVAKDIADVGESSGTTVCHDIYQLAGTCGDDGQTSGSSSDTVTKMTGCYSSSYYMNVEDEEQAGVWMSLCDKKAWADGNNLTWDGITNNSYDCS